MPKTTGALTPTHKIVGPDGTDYFLIRQTRNTVRIKIMFAAAGFAAGEVSKGWGPSAADDIMMGRWIGPVRFHFGAAVDALPDGAHCVEVAPEASTHDYMTAVVWSGWGEAGMTGYRDVALRRAGLPNFGSMLGLPVTPAQVEAVRPAIVAQIAALKDGSYRYRGEPAPASARDEFIMTAEVTLRYLDFVAALNLPERPRTRPARDAELTFARSRLRTGYFKRPEEKAYFERLVASGVWSAPDCREAFTFPGQVMCV